MTTMAALDYLLSEGSGVVFMLTPMCIAYKDLVPAERTDLDDADGWIHLVNLCDKHRGSTAS